MGHFERDLDSLLSRLKDDKDENTGTKLKSLKDWLIHLDKRNIVKINHSVMELVCAKHLILQGYDVSVEHPLTESLVCDLYATKEKENIILEVETGFVPPQNALTPMTYWEARIARKIAKYSNHSDQFGLAAPSHYILQIPLFFLKPPQERNEKEIGEIKDLCDKYFQNPPLCHDELRCGHLSTVYIVNVDEGKVDEVDPNIYFNNSSLFMK